MGAGALTQGAHRGGGSQPGQGLKQLADEIQKLAYDEVPYALFGEFVTPAAFRKNVRGMLPFAAPLLWNISIEA